MYNTQPFARLQPCNISPVLVSAINWCFAGAVETPKLCPACRLGIGTHRRSLETYARMYPFSIANFNLRLRFMETIQCNNKQTTAQAPATCSRPQNCARARRSMTGWLTLISFRKVTQQLPQPQGLFRDWLPAPHGVERTAKMDFRLCDVRRVSRIPGLRLK